MSNQFLQIGRTFKLVGLKTASLFYTKFIFINGPFVTALPEK